MQTRDKQFARKPIARDGDKRSGSVIAKNGESGEPEDIAVFDDYARRKIERVFGYRDLSDEILSELGKEYDE
jgi:hypothetical protein